MFNVRHNNGTAVAVTHEPDGDSQVAASTESARASNRICDCGNPKAPSATSCRACYDKRRRRPGTVHVRGNHNQYDRCECGELKRTTARVCQRCYRAKRSAKRLATESARVCVDCGVGVTKNATRCASCRAAKLRGENWQIRYKYRQRQRMVQRPPEVTPEELKRTSDWWPPWT